MCESGDILSTFKQRNSSKMDVKKAQMEREKATTHMVAARSQRK